ncbi:restriction endonuclease subunit S [Mycoplasma sp. 6243]|uniref:restriction endonuclease subunit S n=1 Tax=Mycoplasma sp. 6243 TaxID=3440865 RepID=UPI003EBF7E41
MSKNILVPSLRFKEFTHAWEQDQIKELFNITRGYVLATKDIFQSQNGENIYPVYSSQTLNNGLLGYYKKISFEDAITWTTDGANAGTVNYREGKFYSINSLWCFIREKNINLTYFLLTHYKTSHLNFVMRAGNPKLMNNTVADITIKVTSSVLEQQKISHLFTSLDSILSLHQRKYNFLMNIKSTLLSKMFPDQNSKFPNIRFSEFTHAWEQDQIKELFNITRGYVLATKDIFQSQNGENIYPVYSSQTLNNGLLGYYKKFLLKMLLHEPPMEQNAGTVNYREGKFYSINVCGVLLEKKYKPNLFLAHSLQNESFKFVMRAGNPKLMNNTVADITIKVTSSVLEQQKISHLFTSLDSILSLHQRQLQIIKNIKKKLLEGMFI